MAQKRIKIICANPDCEEEFRIFNEEKGILLIYCPFCKTEQKIDFEKKEKHEIYRGFKV